MKHYDRSPNEAIDRVLSGLRETEPPDGMRERVLRSARERTSKRHRWSLQLGLTGTRWWAVPAVSVTMIALAVSWTVAHNHRSVRETTHAPANLSPTNHLTAETHLGSAPTARPSHEARLLSEHTALAEPISGEDALAISEMLAPSKPAPPLPLTHQENLLAEVVHHGAPEELATLKADVRAKQMEIAQAEFHDFFEPPSLNPPPVKGN